MAPDLLHRLHEELQVSLQGITLWIHQLPNWSRLLGQGWTDDVQHWAHEARCVACLRVQLRYLRGSISSLPPDLLHRLLKQLSMLRLF